MKGDHDSRCDGRVCWCSGGDVIADDLATLRRELEEALGKLKDEAVRHLQTERERDEVWGELKMEGERADNMVNIAADLKARAERAEAERDEWKLEAEAAKCCDNHANVVEQLQAQIAVENEGREQAERERDEAREEAKDWKSEALTNDDGLEYWKSEINRFRRERDEAQKLLDRLREETGDPNGFSREDAVGWALEQVKIASRAERAEARVGDAITVLDMWARRPKCDRPVPAMIEQMRAALEVEDGV